MTIKEAARLNRQFDRLGRKIPLSAGFLNWARRPSVMLIRLPLAILLILGGVFSFLPILGVWMLPLGLLLLAIDLPILRRPLNMTVLGGERWWTNWRRRRRDRRS